MTEPTFSADTLFDSMPTAIALLDAANNVVEGNACFWSMFGIERTPDALCAALSSIDLADLQSSVAYDVMVRERHCSLTLQRIAGGDAIVHLHDVTDWVERQSEANRSAQRDTLTGLANRAAFLPELARALERRTDVGLVLVDLDQFKGVNDTLGHPIGDVLLKKVAERLISALRPSDHIARLGGDEFAVLQCEAEQPAGVEALAKRLVELVGRPYVIDGHMIDIGASIGVALKGDTADADVLVKQADIALYRAKQAGRGRYCFFEPSMDAEMQERRALEIDLRRALAFRQFELHYQPQMNLKDRVVTGMEALIRWRHPERGLISPATFIPLAEETGLIIPIGEWVIRQACEHATSWASPIPVAVNVSAKQLASGKLVNTVASALANSGLNPDRLEIEITENVLMTDIENCVATLHALRNLGIRISMDDFGTGYSSLSYLQSFPFHTIKIDQSFIRSDDRVKSDGIIRAITAIGRHLGMTTIAEGVETAAQLDNVTNSGCGSAQGYLFSQPVPADEVATMLLRLATTPHGEDYVEPIAQPAPVVEAGLYRLVYYSSNAIMGLDEEVREAVDTILATSQRNNARVGVTGALMFTDGLFAQVLEGQRDAVETVFERIQLDDRHGAVQLLSFGPAQTRVFGNWAMAFVGQDAVGQLRYGHCAAASDFDYAAASSDQITAQLRALLLDDERLSVRKAA